MNKKLNVIEIWLRGHPLTDKIVMSIITLVLWISIALLAIKELQR